MSKKVLENAKEKISDATELDGYEELRPEDQAKLTKAFEEGHVADEDIPDSARKPAGDDGEKPKKKAPAKGKGKKKVSPCAPNRV